MSIPADLRVYTLPSTCIDSDHPEIQALVQRLVNPADSALDTAIAIYSWVRDEIRYNPYALSNDITGFRASQTLQLGEGWCVPKAILLAAMCRACGIPARLGFADVRNHLSTANMRQIMQTDVFYFHGYTVIYLEQQWVKATPAFNAELCDRFGLHALEFNGREDSIYHPFDKEGNRHMEYLNDRGQHLDLPYDEMMTIFRSHYPKMFTELQQLSSPASSSARWQREVAAETAN
jgi:transglutaminase-like putative cysteine protease